jgi:hypothetical protein
MADEIKKAVVQVQYDLLESRLQTLDAGTVLFGPAATIHSMERLVVKNQIDMMRKKYDKWLEPRVFKMSAAEMVKAEKEGREFA